MRLPVVLLAVVAASASAPVVGPLLAQEQPPIRIGEINSYTGPVAAYTTSYRNGMTMALDEINAQGGVLGRKLEVISRDDNFSPADAVRLANELVLSQKVDLLAGTFLSPVALAVASYAQQKKIVFVAAEALTNQLTWAKGSRYVFRVRNPVYMLTKMLVEKAATMPCSRWAGLGPINEAIIDLHKDFRAMMTERRKDFQWVGELTVPNQKLNPGAAIDAIERMDPQCLLNSTFGPDLLAFAREGRTRGFFDKIQVASILSGEPEYLEPLGEDTPVGWWVTGYPAAQDNRSSHAKFREDFQARFKALPKFGALIGYTTIKAIAAGIQRAGSTDTEKLIAGLSGAEFDSPVGRLTIRAADHQVTTGSWLGKLAIKDGQGVMTDWTWMDGKDLLPSEQEARAMRPAGANE
jgi:branched-chain amino acid transport system substrate-binding protein